MLRAILFDGQLDGGKSRKSPGQGSRGNRGDAGHEGRSRVKGGRRSNLVQAANCKQNHAPPLYAPTSLGYGRSRGEPDENRGASMGMGSSAGCARSRFPGALPCTGGGRQGRASGQLEEGTFTGRTGDQSPDHGQRGSFDRAVEEQRSRGRREGTRRGQGGRQG